MVLKMAAPPFSPFKTKIISWVSHTYIPKQENKTEETELSYAFYRIKNFYSFKHYMSSKMSVKYTNTVKMQKTRSLSFFNVLSKTTVFYYYIYYCIL